MATRLLHISTKQQGCMHKCTSYKLSTIHLWQPFISFLANYCHIQCELSWQRGREQVNLEHPSFTISGGHKERSTVFSGSEVDHFLGMIPLQDGSNTKQVALIDGKVLSQPVAKSLWEQTKQETNTTLNHEEVSINFTNQTYVTGHIANLLCYHSWGCVSATAIHNSLLTDELNLALVSHDVASFWCYFVHWKVVIDHIPMLAPTVTDKWITNCCTDFKAQILTT